MTIKHILLGTVDGLLLRLLRPIFYCRVQDAVRRALNPERRGGERPNAKRAQAGYVAEWLNGDRFYFAHQRRFHRYAWPDGPLKVQRELLDKYQSETARILPTDIVVDVGANVGEFTVAAAKIAERVIAFEPDPVPFFCLQCNSEAFDNVQVHQLAVSDEPKEVTFYVSSATADSSVLEPREWTHKHTITAKPIDDVVERADFLKIEAEGFEPEVLRGAERAIRNARVVAVDAGPERYGRPTIDECEAVLTEWGMRTHRKGWVLFGLRDSLAGAARSVPTEAGPLA